MINSYKRVIEEIEKDFTREELNKKDMILVNGYIESLCNKYASDNPLASFMVKKEMRILEMDI